MYILNLYSAIFLLYFCFCLCLRAKIDLDIVKKARIVDDVSFSTIWNNSDP